MNPRALGNGDMRQLAQTRVSPTMSVSVRSRPSAGFSLVELLVVIAILATLVALMLPAITRAIEGSSRNRCGAKTAKLALGMASYNSRQGFFPGTRNPLAIKSPNGNGRLRNSGAVLTPGQFPMPDSNASWFLMILPHLGLTNLYDRCVDGAIWIGSTGTGEASHTRINQDLTFCPSRLDHYNIANGAVNMHYKANGAGAGGAFNRNDGAIGDNANGVFVSLADVAAGDGASNTLLIAEGKRASWMPNTWSDTKNTAGKTICGTFTTVGKHNAAYVVHPDPGGQLLFGFTASGTVSATTPIVNTQQGLFPTTMEQSYANASAAVHPGGANAAFVDGSFRFLRQDLPPHIYGHLLTHRSVWNGSSYSTNSPRAQVFLNALPTTTPPTTNPYPLAPDDF